MANEYRLLDATGQNVAVGTRDQMMSFLKHHSQDGEYALVGPGIDARFYRVGSVIYPGGGQIDGQTILPRSLDECVAEFGPAIEINKGALKDGDISRAEGKVLVVRGAKVSVDKLSSHVSVRVDLALDGDECLSVMIPAPLDSSWAHLAESICLGCGDLWDHCGCSHCVSCEATGPCCEQCECCRECCACEHCLDCDAAGECCEKCDLCSECCECEDGFSSAS